MDEKMKERSEQMARAFLLRRENQKGPVDALHISRELKNHVEEMRAR